RRLLQGRPIVNKSMKLSPSTTALSLPRASQALVRDMRKCRSTLQTPLPLGCVKKCEQSLVFFCVVTLPEGQRRLGVYPRPVPGCGNRVQSGVAFGCRTPRHIPLLQTVLVRGCETIGGNTSRSLRKRRNFPQRHYPNTRRYDP